MSAFATNLSQKLKDQGDASRANQMAAYMRNQFVCFGVMSTPRKQALRETYRECGLPDKAVEVVKELFQAPERELNYCGQELMLKAKKQWNETTLKTLEWMITTRSWWDTVDYIVSNLVDTLAKLQPEVIPSIQKWALSDDIWLIRTSILYQLKYKDQTDTAWLTEVIEMHAHQKEFFIKKAIGWILREYAKIDPDWVRAFLDKHDLQPLSVREASKHL
jgi:3-methyladenine DNA glycosylase AlkD